MKGIRATSGVVYDKIITGPNEVAEWRASNDGNVRKRSKPDKAQSFEISLSRLAFLQDSRDHVASVGDDRIGPPPKVVVRYDVVCA